MSAVSLKSNIETVQRKLVAYDKKRIKAAQAAVKVEGFRLMKILKAQIRAGAPGGRAFAPLSRMAAYRRHGNRKKPPLYRLAIPVRYRADYRDGHMAVSIGFVDPYKGPAISKSWKHIAQFHQSGASIPVDAAMEKALREMGGRLKKRKNTRNMANVFFLRKSTTRFDVPARPIVDPFWQAHESETNRRIIDNFAKKMRGKQI